MTEITETGTAMSEIDATALVDSLSYTRPDEIRHLLQRLREEQPVCYVEPALIRPFWAVTRYEDIRHIESSPELFSAEPRAVLLHSALEQTNLARFGDMQGVKTLVHMDGPRHLALRGITRNWFMPKNVAAMRDKVDALAAQFIERMRAMDGECDFAADVAFWYPLRVAMLLIGIPESDEANFLRLTQQLFAPESFVTETRDVSAVVTETITEMVGYFMALAEDRRQNPRDDIATVLATAEIDGQAIDVYELTSYFTILVTAGHDTTSASLAGGLHALIQFPEQRQLLLDEPELINDAADEMVRWVTPVKHFARTVLQDTELSGVMLKQGETIAMFFESANRDEAAIPRPDVFDVRRGNSRHMAFGHGRHNCLGMHLARMEIASFIRQLLPQLEHIEMAGEPAYIQSGFVSGLNSLPIRYRFKG